jgi:hypothetical protein
MSDVWRRLLMLERRLAAAENRYMAAAEIYKRSLSVIVDFEAKPLRIPNRPKVLKDLNLGYDPVDEFELGGFHE